MAKPCRAIVLIEVEIPVNLDWNTACDWDFAITQKAEELLRDENDNVHLIIKDYGEK